MHLRNDRLVHVEQLDPQLLPLFQPPDVVVDFHAAAILRTAAGRKFIQVRAGAKMRAGAAQDNAVNRVEFIRLLQRRIQFAQQFSAERIPALGPVKRHDGGGAFDLVGDLFEFHWFPPYVFFLGRPGSRDAASIPATASPASTQNATANASAGA